MTEEAKKAPQSRKRASKTAGSNGNSKTKQAAVAIVSEEIVEAAETATVTKLVKTASEEIEETEEIEEFLDFFQETFEQEDSGPETRPHAFVVMPFGQKKGLDDQIIDFNAIYLELIKPALEDAGFEAFRADEETVSGDILTDMFQELLLADLVIADMSIDNGNVFYELGVRHAFRKRGVVHIQSGRAYMPFDIFNVRTIPYHTGDDGKPDPEFLEKDRQAIARVCRDTHASEAESVHSPIFNLLNGLVEPDRKTLSTHKATGFWREYKDWKQRVAIAQRQKRIGDILLLTEEISNPLIKEEAIGEAGKALRSMGRDELALEQYRQGLEINPGNIEFQRQEAYFLNRLHRVDEAIVKLEHLLEDRPSDTDAIGKLGRIYKDMWQEGWHQFEDDEARQREAFESYHWLLKSYHTYLKGYHADLNGFYTGTNALQLGVMLIHLADRFDDPEDPDPEICAVRDMLPTLKATLTFSLENLAQDEKSDYWTLVSLANLKVITESKPIRIRRAYRKALTAARKNIFQLESELHSLNLLRSLGVRVESVDAGIKILQEEIDRIQKDQNVDDDDAVPPPGTEVWSFIFTGHMIDRDGRPIMRFPAALEAEVKKQIMASLKKLEADGNDYAFLAGAACGGDIIFIESCLELGVKVAVHLPFPEPLYIKKFVSYGDDQWIDRYYQLRNNPNVDIQFQAERVGTMKKGDSVYERNNRWALYSSLILGIDKVRLIALWDGQSGPEQDMDGRLVSHMVSQMRRMGGVVEQLNITKFDYSAVTR